MVRRSRSVSFDEAVTVIRTSDTEEESKGDGKEHSDEKRGQLVVR